MKNLLKIVLWICLVVVITAAASWITVVIFRDDIFAFVETTINSRITTKTRVGKYSFSVLKRFPRASVKLSDVTLLSSTGFDKREFTDYNADTLLYAGSVTLEFRLTDLMKGIYRIENASVSDGTLNLLTDSAGGINYQISPGSGKNTGSGRFDLNRIVLRNINTLYLNRSTSLNISGNIDNAKLRSVIKGTVIDFICSAGLTVNRFELYKTRINASADISLDINMQSSDTSVVFRKGTLKLEGYSFDLSGFIHPGKDILLKVTGTNIDLAGVRKYIPAIYGDRIRNYQAGGVLNADYVLYGPLDRTKNLFADAHFSVKRGSLSVRNPEIKIRNLELQGSYSNGSKAGPSTSKLLVDKCSFNIGNALWTASLYAYDFTDANVSFTFTGDIWPAELRNYLKIPGLISADGLIRLNTSISGHIFKNGRINAGALASSIKAADIRFESFSLKHTDERFNISNVSGNIMASENLWADNLAFTFCGASFLLNGEFAGLPAWLSGKQVPLDIKAEITASDLDPSMIKLNTGKSGTRKGAIHLPGGINADFLVRLDNFSYKKFNANLITGRLIYKPRMADFRNLNALTLGGKLSGNFIMAGNSDGTFISQGNFNLESIDIKKCFESFGNFGQSFILAENLAGTLAGSLRILMPMDSMMRPVVKAVNAEGRYIIENGTLTNFEPVKALSDFIDIKELENIKFSKIENDLFIRNNALSVPQMEILSSAADFSVSGKHSFDNSYEYHIKVYLSEILSGKYRKSKKLNSEFGTIEDDGLGRTSLFLKITGKDDNIKVSYDIKAAGSNIRENIKKERNNLRNILNEEYGWFRQDTLSKKTPEPAPRFRIEWSETADSAAATNTKTVEEPDNLLNRLLRRKKNNNP
ncbi:MAG: AsmA-like C-terminal region-containing protein [Bacteroidales bacterium]|nr:AsmA-like C-terminal region-containing protein [Bacteroidales bacterium]